LYVTAQNLNKTISFKNFVVPFLAVCASTPQGLVADQDSYVPRGSSGVMMLATPTGFTASIFWFTAFFCVVKAGDRGIVHETMVYYPRPRGRDQGSYLHQLLRSCCHKQDSDINVFAILARLKLFHNKEEGSSA